MNTELKTESAQKKSPAKQAAKANAKQRVFPNNFDMLLQQGKMSLKDVENGIKQIGADISYPVLLDLKNKKRPGFNRRTILAIVDFLNQSGKLRRKITPDYLMGKIKEKKKVKPRKKAA